MIVIQVFYFQYCFLPGSQYEVEFNSMCDYLKNANRGLGKHNISFNSDKHITTHKTNSHSGSTILMQYNVLIPAFVKINEIL